MLLLLIHDIKKLGFGLDEVTLYLEIKLNTEGVSNLFTVCVCNNKSIGRQKCRGVSRVILQCGLPPCLVQCSGMRRVSVLGGERSAEDAPFGV